VLNLDLELSKFLSSSFPASRSEFKYSRNQASKSSVIPKKHPSTEKILEPSYPSDAVLLRRWSFAIKKTPQLQHFLAPVSARNLIMKDHKAFSFRSICHLVYLLEPNLLLSSKNSIRFQIFIENFAPCCLPMPITIARFTGMRHAIIRCKSVEDVCKFGIQSFWSFHFEFWVKN
jgi:hypothetical protein